MVEPNSNVNPKYNYSQSIRRGKNPALPSKLKLEFALSSKVTSWAQAERPMALARRVILAAPAYSSITSNCWSVGHISRNEVAKTKRTNALVIDNSHCLTYLCPERWFFQTVSAHLTGRILQIGVSWSTTLHEAPYGVVDLVPIHGAKPLRVPKPKITA